MNTYTVSDAILRTDDAREYFERADRRIRAGMRVALTMLGIPLPDYAQPRHPGPLPAKGVLAAFNADNPKQPNYKVARRKPNASPEVIAAAKHRSAHRLGRNPS